METFVDTSLYPNQNPDNSVMIYPSMFCQFWIKMKKIHIPGKTELNKITFLIDLSM